MRIIVTSTSNSQTNGNEENQNSNNSNVQQQNNVGIDVTFNNPNWRGIAIPTNNNPLIETNQNQSGGGIFVSDLERFPSNANSSSFVENNERTNNIMLTNRYNQSPSNYIPSSSSSTTTTTTTTSTSRTTSNTNENNNNEQGKQKRQKKYPNEHQNKNFTTTSSILVKNHNNEIILNENNNNQTNTNTNSNAQPQMTLEQIQKFIELQKQQFDQFQDALKSQRKMFIKPMGDDGNCLFRSIAEQVYGDQEMHDQVRVRCMDFIVANRDHYSQFVVEDFDAYVKRKRQDRVFGNNLEIQAISEMYNRPIEIYTFENGELKVVNIFQEQYQTDNAPIRLSYHNRNHYNAVIDPENPSVGVGLGLPDLKPGLADQMQMKKAVEESESALLENTMIKELQKQNDLEMLEGDIEKSILEQSLLEATQKDMGEIERSILEQSLIEATEKDLEREILEQSRRDYYESFKKQKQ